MEAELLCDLLYVLTCLPVVCVYEIALYRSAIYFLFSCVQRNN